MDMFYFKTKPNRWFDYLFPGSQQLDDNCHSLSQTKEISIQAKKCFMIVFSIGFFLGSFIMPVWTHNVESAQVIANVLNYSSDNPMYIGHSGLYSLLIQIPALLLHIGCSEWFLCVLFSGIQCALAFSSVSLVTFIFSRNFFISLLMPLLLLHLSHHQPFWPDNYYAVFHGHAYPLLFPLNTSLYGLIGICIVVLIFCFSSLGWFRSAAFMAGLFPSIHPTLALASWIGLSLCITEIIEHHCFRKVIKFFFIGLLIFGISALSHVIISGPSPPIEPEIKECLAHASVSDHHSLNSHFSTSIKAIQFFEPDMYILVLFFILIHSTWLNYSMIIFIKTLSIVIMVATLYVSFGLIFPDTINVYPINALMIPRWLNLSSLVFPCILTGLLTYVFQIQRQQKVFWILVIYFLLILSGNLKGVTVMSSLNTIHQSISIMELMSAGFIMLMVFVCLTAIIKKKANETRSMPAKLNNRSVQVLCYVIMISFVLIDCLWIKIYKHSLTKDAEQMIEQLKTGHGVILTTAPFWKLAPLQLRTNRELLADLSQSNGIYYVPHCISKAKETLQKIFHMDLCSSFNDPEKITKVLESRSYEDWQIIAAQYKVTNILTPGSMRLNLPICFQNRSYRLYCL